MSDLLGPDPNLNWDPDDPELGAVPDAIHEEPPPDPSKTLSVTPEQAGWDDQMREAAWLLSLAIHRLGGALVITKEERMRAPHYTMGWDVKFTNDTGGIRIFSVLEGETT
jgi:hypothetical protein